ncbi:MAG: hypothetical protein KGI90_17685 [Burkholderiales bacterium]|nr:hypothetical protein [Burkholderiales bacterium]
MFRNTLVAAAIATLVAGCATAVAPAAQPLMIAPSPVTFHGHVAGQPTNMIFVMVPDPSPEVAGFGMRAGDTLRIALPEAFRRNPAVAISADTDLNLVLTKGWPQRDVRLEGQYRVGYDDATHSMVVTATRDIAPEGANAPGIKVIHLRGRTFINPAPGHYPVTLTHVAANGSLLATWHGQVEVLEHEPQTRLAPSNFQLAPPLNSTFQQVAPGQVAPYALGLLLWGPHGVPMNGVGIAPRDLGHYPRYTGGLLVQDTNGDHRLDPATDKVVGGIIGAAPQGATGQAATSPVRPDGTPILSGEVLRDPAYPAAMGGGKVNPGLLTIQFKAGDKPGLYRPTVELISGNAYRFTIEVEAR